MTPQPIECLSALPIRHIACGGDHCIVLSMSGAVYAWGRNNKGQLGLGDTENRRFPTQIRSLRTQGIVYVACGMEHTVCLTEDGGVFTFGGGSYGQLGHGSKNDEQLPRKVIELMGTEVSQIACGHRHTLALVPSRGRLYSFGLGGSGQLGNSDTVNAPTPQVVQGPWVSPRGEPAAAPKRIMDKFADVTNKAVVIYVIGAGGDHSYASVCKADSLEEVDHRQAKAPIETLTDDLLDKIYSATTDEVLEQDFLERLETVFSSCACLNGSLLLPTHIPCTSKNNGIDFTKWATVVDKITACSNDTLKDMVTTNLTKFVLPKLESSPPDVETLRMFLTLPMFNEFSRVDLYKEIHAPYAKGFIALPKAAWNVVEKWLALQSAEYILPLINNYKRWVVHMLQLQSKAEMPNIYNSDLELSLIFLRILNRINVDQDCIVGYEDFYIPEIGDFIDLPSSYIHWIVAKIQGRSATEFHICNFPFMFDASAKTTLLQIDQAFQMQNAVQQASNVAAMLALFNPNINPEEMQMLVLNVHRGRIVEDTINFIRCVDPADFKKPLKVRFAGEEGEDAGGVRKEFFLLLLKEILDPNYGMFKVYDETNTIWFHPGCFEDHIMFRLIGVLCGLAIYNFTIINLPFPLPLYKKLLGNHVVAVDDLECLSPSVAKGLRDLLEYEQEDDLEDTFGLNFTITEDVIGGVRTVELKKNGDKLSVNKDNRKEYVDLYCDHVLNKAVEVMYRAFHEGFHEVCGGRVLDLFHARELMALVVGTENYDWNEFEKNTKYQGGYDKDHATITYFWQVFHALSEEEKKQFLLFLTGTDRIPILGMTALNLTIQKAGDDNFLPVAHTCFNLLDLPAYATREKLRFKLLQAIQGTEGFGLV